MNYNGYVSRSSFIHRLNPSMKFLSSIIFIVLIFIPYGFFSQVILLVVLLSIYFIARLPVKRLINIIISIIVMFVILIFVNWLTYKTPGVVFDVNSHAKFLVDTSSLKIDGHYYVDPTSGKVFLQGYVFGNGIVNQADLVGITGLDINTYNNGFVNLSNDATVYNQAVKQITEKGYKVIQSANNTWIYIYKSNWYAFSTFALTLTISVSLKIFLMILIVTVLTATTSSVELTYALEDILNPLRVFRLPVTEWSTTIALGIRFIPSLLDESERIMNAQASRGLDFKNGNLKDKLYSLVSFIVPLFSIAFKKADELANAMEARGYNPRYTRTRYRDYKITAFDWLGYFILVLFLGFTIAMTAIMSNKVAYISPFGLLEAVSMFGS